MPFAVVNGEPITQLPRDLYIPPQALEVFLEAFEGPLDLLLYLIRRQNLDILDIPLAEITRQYMQYIELMQDLQLELAGEYLVMAATLAEIKSRMLLPRPPGAGDEAEEDPRAELVRRLQEYERFKRAAEGIDALPRLERDVWSDVAPSCKRPAGGAHAAADHAAGDAARLQGSGGARGDVRAPSHAARAAVGARAHERHSRRAREHGSFVEFVQLFRPEEGRMGVTVTFIAILELVREGLIEIVQAEPYAPLHVRARQPGAARCTWWPTTAARRTPRPSAPARRGAHDERAPTCATSSRRRCWPRAAAAARRAVAAVRRERAARRAQQLRAALDALAAEYAGRGIELKETASGFRIQVRRELAAEISRLWPERPARYSRALLETLALIAYRQPITRAEIEAVRGVAVNPNIIQTLLERNWVRVVGHRDVPGRPELLGTTREFLDYFGLKSLDELPPLAELQGRSATSTCSWRSAPSAAAARRRSGRGAGLSGAPMPRAMPEDGARGGRAVGRRRRLRASWSPARAPGRTDAPRGARARGARGARERAAAVRGGHAGARAARAERCRRCWRAPGSPRAARRKPGSAPAASPSTASPPRSASRVAASDEVRLDGRLVRARPPRRAARACFSVTAPRASRCDARERRCGRRRCRAPAACSSGCRGAPAGASSP